jgi:hypothetical protein
VRGLCELHVLFLRLCARRRTATGLLRRRLYRHLVDRASAWHVQLFDIDRIAAVPPRRGVTALVLAVRSLASLGRAD